MAEKAYSTVARDLPPQNAAGMLERAAYCASLQRHPFDLDLKLSLRLSDGTMDKYNPLYVALIQAYGQEGLIKTAHNAVLDLTNGVEYRPEPQLRSVTYNDPPANNEADAFEARASAQY